ncbi:MAG: hypothetical protein RJA44_2702 [Pseudomonadota bacterium]
MTSNSPGSPRILVAGAAGYIGSLLVRELLARGWRVLAVDRMYFGERPLIDLMKDPAFTLLRADLCRLDPMHLRGMHAVVDLASLCHDESTDLDPDWADTFNHRARVRLATLAREAGVARHVLVSSTAVYGSTRAAEVDETTPARPDSLAAHATLQAEQGCLALRRDGFAPTVLRLGSVHGVSPRMRFDLLVNRMTLGASRQRCVTLPQHGGRSQAHLHIDDAVGAILRTLQAPLERVDGEIYNIGQTNLRPIEVAHIVREVLGGKLQWLAEGAAAEPHHHHVRFGKAVLRLGWQPTGSLYTAVQEVATALDCGRVADTPETHTLQWYRHLRACEQLLGSGSRMAHRTLH